MSKRSKILFFITSSDNLAKGGHFRSCLTIAKSLNEDVDVEIVNVGKILSPIFLQNEILVTFIPITIFNILFQLSFLVRKVSDAGNIKLVAFDFFSYFIVRNISFFTKTPISFIRCGGKNPKFSPYSQTVFNFSKENYDFYRRQIAFKNSNLILVPNRIKKEPSNALKMSTTLREAVKNSYPIILRVGRFVPNYEKVNESALNLSSFLDGYNIKHNLVFIGYPDTDDSASYKLIKNTASKFKHIFVFDTPEFTVKGARFLYEASLVIGTGRGAMEAIVESIPLAIYSSSSELPVIVDSDSIFDLAFEKNFSQRVSLNNYPNSTVETNLKKFFQDKDYETAVSNFQDGKKKYFDIDLARPKYLEAFSQMRFDDKIRLLDYLKHLKLFLFKLYYMATRAKNA